MLYGFRSTVSITPSGRRNCSFARRLDAQQPTRGAVGIGTDDIGGDRNSSRRRRPCSGFRRVPRPSPDARMRTSSTRPYRGNPAPRCSRRKTHQDSNWADLARAQHLPRPGTRDCSAAGSRVNGSTDRPYRSPPGVWLGAECDPSLEDHQIGGRSRESLPPGQLCHGVLLQPDGSRRGRLTVCPCIAKNQSRPMARTK